jgi:hypothetical protein
VTESGPSFQYSSNPDQATTSKALSAVDKLAGVIVRQSPGVGPTVPSETLQDIPGADRASRVAPRPMVPYRAPVYTPSAAPMSPLDRQPDRIRMETQDDGSIQYRYLHGV